MIQTLIKVQSGQCWHCIVSSDLIFLYFDKIALLMQENAFLLCSWLTDFVNVSKVMQTNFLNSEENNGFLKSLNCIIIIQTLNQSSQDNADMCYTFLAFNSSSWNLSYFDKLTLLMQEKTYFSLNMFPPDWFCECFNLILTDFLNFMFLFPDL